MQFMGSKRRIAREILPIMLKDREPEQYFVDLFCGGCNLLDKVEGNRIGNDLHYYLIEMWKALQQGWIPPDLITEDEYNAFKDNKDDYPLHLIGYAGFMSFGGKWFAGYRRSVAGTKGDIKNMEYQSKNHKNVIMSQVKALQDVKFHSLDYTKVPLPENSIIYCDIPYTDTTKYKDKFDHIRFWEWAEGIAKQGHKIYVSEYQAPQGWKAVWSKDVKTNIFASNLNDKNRTEKLYTYAL